MGQKDFNQGLLRIRKSDISEKEKEEYPVAGEHCGECHMGYFAVITIETDDNTIDLDVYELKQSIEFYFQPSFFTDIGLSSGQFLPGQEPGFFGADAVVVNKFELHNGILGGSSQLGLHGNYPNEFVLKDIHIRHFGTHGLQLNGWENVEIDNIENGLSSKEEWLLSDYAHARLTVSRLKSMIEEYTVYDDVGDASPISISNKYNHSKRGTTGNQILCQIEYRMSLAYDYVINRYDNRYYNRHTDNDCITPDLTEENDDQDDSRKDFEYIGNVLTNSYAAMCELSESWECNGFLVMEPLFYNWVCDKLVSDDDIHKLNSGCNTDVMQHSGKELLRLCMDAVYDVEISKFCVYNLYSKRSLDATYCGEYDGNALNSDDAPDNDGHFRQITPQQSRFGDNNDKMMVVWNGRFLIE